jgi:glycerophosphoryl diester phosphodiesterase
MKIIGHRGAAGLAPENTIASLRKALEHHVDGLEFDLRVTMDGVVIVHHDAKLTDPDGKQYLIAKHSYNELKRHKPDLATFEEVLETIGHPVLLQVEVKPGEPIKPIVTIIKAYLKKGWQPSYFQLASFSQSTLVALQAELPEIEKVVNEKWSGVRASYRGRQLHTKRLNMSQRWLWRGFITSMTRRGWKLSAYHLNDPIKAKRWAAYGLYSLTTDYPDRFEKR